MRALLLLAIAVVPDTAAALTVRYSAPAECPPVAVVRASVAEGLGGAPDDGAETVRIAVSADRSAARLALVDADGRALGERVVRSTAGDCEALVRAAGLSAGLALAPLRSAPSPTAAVPAASAVSAVPAVPDTRWSLRGASGVGIGLHPGVALTLDGGLAVAMGRWSGRIALWAAGSPALLDGAVGSGRVRSASLALGLAGCGDQGRWTACAGARAGLQVHSGSDFVADTDSTGPWLAGLLAIEWRVFGGVWGPRLEAMVPVGRLTLTVDDAPVWTTPWFAGTVGLAGRW